MKLSLYYYDVSMTTLEYKFITHPVHGSSLEIYHYFFIVRDRIRRQIFCISTSFFSWNQKNTLTNNGFIKKCIYIYIYIVQIITAIHFLDELNIYIYMYLVSRWASPKKETLRESASVESSRVMCGPFGIRECNKQDSHRHQPAQEKATTNTIYFHLFDISSPTFLLLPSNI